MFRIIILVVLSLTAQNSFASEDRIYLRDELHGFDIFYRLANYYGWTEARPDIPEDVYRRFVTPDGAVSIESRRWHHHLGHIVTDNVIRIDSSFSDPTETKITEENSIVRVEFVGFHSLFFFRPFVTEDHPYEPDGFYNQVSIETEDGEVVRKPVLTLSCPSFAPCVMEIYRRDLLYY